jgi:hypothetical protein
MVSTPMVNVIPIVVGGPITGLYMVYSFKQVSQLPLTPGSSVHSAHNCIPWRLLKRLKMKRLDLDSMGMGLFSHEVNSPFKQDGDSL